MLTHLLGQESYALCITPGFFRFYSEIGILEALEEADCLRPSHVTGSSAGAMVGAMIAAGMKPKEVIERMLAVQRSDVWDVGGIGGLLKGELAQQIFQDILPVKTFEECPIPCAVTAFDLVRMRTKFLASGNLALAVRASITFPGLFQPVMIDGTPHIDGGVWDHVGMMALEHCLQIGNERKKKEHESKSEESFVEEDFTNKLVVNVVYSTPSGSSLPKALQKCRLLTIVVENIPMVTPFSMNTMGPLAYKKSRAAMRKALVSAHIQEHAPNHWICYVDGALVKDDELEISIPPLQLKLERQTSVMSEMTDMIDTTPRLSFPPTTPTIPTTSSTQTLLIEEIQSDENQSSHHGSVIALSDVSTPVVLKTDSTSTHHHTTTTIVEKDHFICQVPIEGDSSHMALVDHQLIHKTTTVTRDQETDQVNEEGEQKNILETMIEELYEKDNVIQIVDAHSQITDNLPLSSDTTSMEVEEGMSNNENVIESVLTTVKSSEKAEPQPEVLTHVPFAPTSSDSSSTLPTEDSQKTELKPETRQTRSTSFTSANLPDFIRIPSFSFINGTYYLYEKVSTTINSGMTTASETSNQLLNAVTTTIHTTFSSTTDDEEVVVGEKRSRGSDDTDVNEDNEEEGPDSLSEDKSPTKRVKGESDQGFDGLLGR